MIVLPLGRDLGGERARDESDSQYSQRALSTLAYNLRLGVFVLSPYCLVFVGNINLCSRDTRP